jgi:hypothetical protein
MNQFDRWVDHRLKMKNAGKTLIVGVLLAEVVAGAYFLIDKDDTATVPAETEKSSLATLVPADSRPDGAHATAGSVMGASSTAALDERAVTVGQAVAVGRIAPELSAPAVIRMPQQSQPNQPVRKTARKDVPARGKHAVAAAPSVKPQKLAGSNEVGSKDKQNRKRANSVSSAMTNQLVKDSAKLDPSLPPPLPKDATSHHSSNPVAAAMTDQLVRESANVNTSPTKRGMK